MYSLSRELHFQLKLLLFCSLNLSSCSRFEKMDIRGSLCQLPFSITHIYIVQLASIGICMCMQVLMCAVGIVFMEEVV